MTASWHGLAARSRRGRSTIASPSRSSAPPRRAAPGTGADRRSRAGRPSGGRSPPRRTCPGRRGSRCARAPRAGSGGRTAGRRRGACRARRRGSATRRTGTCSDACGVVRLGVRSLVLDRDVDAGVGHGVDLRGRAPRGRAAAAGSTIALVGDEAGEAGAENGLLAARRRKRLDAPRRAGSRRARA